jgi:hypothetical protein
VTSDLAELGEHEDARVRYALAKGLVPAGNAEIDLLQKLAADPIADVRTAARASLGGAIPWWHGKLSRDPSAALSLEEQVAHKAALERVSALLDRPGHEVASARPELVAVAASLPDVIALDLAETTLGNAAAVAHGDPLLPFLLTRPGGGDAALRLLRRWSEADHRSYRATLSLGDALRALPSPARGALCWQLARAALAAPPEERDRYESAASLAAQLAKDAWPPEEDTEPLFDALLAAHAAAEPAENDRVFMQLAAALARPAEGSTRMIERALASRVAGHASAPPTLRWALDRLADAAPPAPLRAAAIEALQSDDDATATWAIGHLLGAAHDAALDPPRAELVERLLGVARHRALILASPLLPRLAGAPLRRALRRGELPWAEAAAAMLAIDALHGGLLSQFLPRFDRTAEDNQARLEQHRAGQRRELADFLGPEELQGPPTEDEWRALREARAGVPRTSPNWRLLLAVLTPGPAWPPDERALLDEAIAAMRGGDIPAAEALVRALGARPRAEDLPLFDELRALLGPSRWLTMHRRAVVAALGLPKEAMKAGDAGATSWMDEPEE